MGVEIPDGQGLHLGEKLVAHPLQRALGHIGHDDAAQIDRRDARQIDQGQTAQRAGQGAEIRVFHAHDGQDVDVDELLHEQCAPQMGVGAHANEDGHDHQMHRIAAENIFESPPQRSLVQGAGGVSSSSGSHKSSSFLTRRGRRSRRRPWSGSHRSPGRCGCSSGDFHGCRSPRPGRRPAQGSGPRPGRWRSAGR